MGKTEKQYKQLSAEERATIMLMQRNGSGQRGIRSSKASFGDDQAAFFVVGRDILEEQQAGLLAIHRQMQ